jgi:hypothetical protein
LTDTRALTSVPQIGLVERILRIFHAPRRTFESITDGGGFPDWAAPVALVILFWAGHNLAALPIVAPDTPSSIHGWEQLTEEQRQMATQGLEVWRSHGWFSTPLVVSFSSLAIVGLALLGISRWVLRAQLSLRQALAVKAYAALVAIPQWILLTPLVRAGDATASPLNFTAGVFIENPAASQFGRFLGSLNVFDLWQAIVIGIGLAVMSGQSSKRTVSIIVVLWLAWGAIGALAPAAGPLPPTP